MPRRHRSAREREPPAAVRPPRGVVPSWAHVAGFVVSQSTKGNSRCPGCNQVIREGTPHLVVHDEGDLEGRRHWHMECWRQERRRAGGV